MSQKHLRHLVSRLSPLMPQFRDTINCQMYPRIINNEAFWNKRNIHYIHTPTISQII